MSKKIDRLIIAARKAAEEYEAARKAALEARAANLDAQNRLSAAERDSGRADGALLEAVRKS